MAGPQFKDFYRFLGFWASSRGASRKDAQRTTWNNMIKNFLSPQLQLWPASCSILFILPSFAETGFPGVVPREADFVSSPGIFPALGRPPGTSKQHAEIKQ